MDWTPGLRREPPFDPSTVESDPVLAERIRDEIRRDGPMTFARFMDLALYDPERGYYMGPNARPGGAGGDFLTAPETHPVFGATIGRVLVQAWERLGRPAPFAVREFGAGAGALAIGALDELRASGSGLGGVIRWDAAEISPVRRAAFRERLVTAGHEAAASSIPEQITGCILANEFLDALPVHRVIGRAAGPGQPPIDELFVTLDGDGFAELPGAPSTPALAERLARVGVTLAEGQRGEINLAIDGWVATAAANLERGLVIAIDYMLPAADLYGPGRPDGTLRAFLGQRVHGDPFRHIGRQDLTAHVDRTALELAATEAGLDVLGTTSQAEFLAGGGLGDLAEAHRHAPGATIEGLLALRAALGRLLDPRATGGFRVVVLGREFPPDPPLSALTFRRPGAR